MIIPEWQVGWIIFCVGISVGLSKTGLAGFGLITVVIMAHIYDPAKSVGLLLPILICGDVCATLIFGKHVEWRRLGIFLAAAVPGIAIGFLLLDVVDKNIYGQIMGAIIMIFCALNVLRWTLGDKITNFVHGKALGAGIGVLSGTTTMMTNSAGPLVALYFLAVSMPKYAVVGTAAWCFLITNIVKLPLFAQLGMLDKATFGILLWAVPGVLVGSWLGSKVMPHLSQRLFEILIIIFAFLGAMKLIIS